ncbi:MAG: tripartite tricarboxylate transporter TctB family protein [Rhodobacteraceae bacterium]|nr:tripartite tricarboxylate transporter TctB family protein [Paracoccaceae bacterium]
MNRFTLRATPEIVVLTGLLVLSLLGIVFISALVAPPKLLFGRSLTAVEPSLFPSIVFVFIALLSVVLLFKLNKQGGHENQASMTQSEWRRGIVFFGIMTLYALTMAPFGFLISSATAVALLSWQMGNRSWLQAVVLSLGGPVLLYLAATRLLAVSLPELNAIELFYARILG